jgi:ADP-heptose:LPS heptosyltransferase
VPEGDTGPDPVRRVCVFARTWHQGLGDLVPVNVFLQVLRQAYPRAEITHVVGEAAAARQAEFFARHSCADRIVPCPNYWDHERGHWAEFFAGVRSAAYDCCILDPLSQPLVAKEMAGCGVGVRIGFASGAADEQYLTSAIPVRPPGGCPDLLDFARALAGAVGVPAPAPEAAVPWFPFAAQPVPVLPPPVVAMHPGGEAYWNRRWPLARFGELGRRLAAGKGEVGGASLVLLGSAEEAGDLAGLAGLAGAGAVTQVCAGEPLDTVASWLAAADVLVGNDSALAHVAAALGTPTVVLYGPSGDGSLWKRLYPRLRGVHGHGACEPVHTGPLVEGRAPCAHSCPRPYVSAAGPYPYCMTRIELAEVHKVVQEILAGQAQWSAGARG